MKAEASKLFGFIMNRGGVTADSSVTPIVTEHTEMNVEYICLIDYNSSC